MKKLLFTLLAIMPLFCYAQEQKYVYCELVGTEKFLSKKCTVQIDFGQNPYKDNRIVGENGKSKTFNSMVDAMNYMGKLGWKFQQAYVVTMPSGMGGGQNVYHWLLIKEIADGESINDGIKTKYDSKDEE